jgi:putative ABC transport system permease protein
MSLTVGFACTCLLVSFLIGEGNADSFNTKKDRVFELSSNDPFGGSQGAGRIAFTNGAVPGYMIDTYPEIENICQVSNVDKTELSIDGKLSSVTSIAVDTSFFTMFEFPLLSGSTKGLTSPGLMITDKKARQLFGTTDVLGRMVTLRTPDSTKLFAIAGVIGEAKEKSHLTFDVVVAEDAIVGSLIKQKQGGVTYMMLRDGSNPTQLLSKVNSDSLRPTLIGQGKLDYFLDPLDKAYTMSWNRTKFMKTRSEVFIWVGWAVCGVIFFMASFNFVNLFLLSVQERKKETGIQKTLGISLWQTLRGSAVEAGVYIGISFVLSLILAYSLIPLFNNTLNADLQFDYLSRLKVLSVVGGSLLLIAVIVVLTSTLQQRRTLPVSMMRNVSAKVRYSKLFFTVQFFVSITLCVCTVTIVKQMKFLENEPLGFNRNILQLNSPRNNTKDNLGSLKNEVLKIAGIENVALSAGNPISGNMIVFLELEDKTPFNPYLFSGDKDLVKTLDLELIAGSFNITGPSEKVVNETLVKKFNMKNPIGETIPGTKGDRIAGVVKDFTCSSFKQEIPPVIISYNEKARNLLVDYGNNDLDALLPKIKSAWSQVFPDDYFDYIIVQQDLMKKYSEETLFYKIVLSASVTSMIISCFGMFALSWAVIRSRAKEMGIRKILGASVASILGLLTISFAKRLMLAFFLAAPAGYYIMNLWLSRFVNKAPIDSWVFVITGVSLAAIAMVTLGIQTLKASLSSPLEEIKE